MKQSRGSQYLRVLRIGAIALPFLGVIAMAGVQAPGDDAEFRIEIVEAAGGPETGRAGSDRGGAVPPTGSGARRHAGLIVIGGHRRRSKRTGDRQAQLRRGGGDARSHHRVAGRKPDEHHCHVQAGGRV